MSLEHAILGFLEYKPLSGYCLKSAFNASVQHFWPADQSQIYRTLARIAERGWADVEIVEQDVRPDRKVYRITDEGKKELHRWLSAPLAPKTQRTAELIQIFFAGQLSDEEALAVFRGYVEQTRGLLEHLRDVPRESCDYEHEEPPKPRDEFFWWLTLNYGIHLTEAKLKWYEDIVKLLEQGKGDDS